MDWANLIETLTEEQQHLQELVDAIKSQQEAYRPSMDDWDDLIRRPASSLLQGVATHHTHPNVPLAAMAVSQIKFNQAVISMLTDLDHRKNE